MIKFISFTLLLFGLPLAKAQAPLDCGKYSTASTQQGPACHRVGILPWFAALPDQWETELRLGTTGDTVRFGYWFSPSLNYYDINFLVEDQSTGSKLLDGVTGLPVRRYASHWTRILAACHIRAGVCPLEGETGAMIVTVDAPSVAALEAASAYGIYKLTSSGSVLTQTAAPVVFMDQAAVRWSAIVTETPRDQQSQAGSTVTSFAVTNLSTVAQAVLVRVYNQIGSLVASAKTPVLGAGATEVPVGGIHADTLANLLGVDLVATSCPTTTPGQNNGPGCTSAPAFRGTVVFEGEQGGKIIPVVFRFNGSALTSVPVRVE